ncbi:ABC transporter ATP-binding protein [Timonella sp. A28]|uniref:ABC transporter ATP-binding protein n=1 Tax=Timonella sp. A28 TaxID=3442640 RepID=UPI003EBB77B2
MVALDTAHISARGVTRIFGTGHAQVTALSDVDVNIHSNNFTVILGPSGSGKSTLLNILGGMDRPTSGRITAGDKALESLSEQELTNYRRTQVGFVFQFYNLIPNLTASENVALAAALVMPHKEAAHVAKQLLEEVGLGHRLNQFPRHLSGGEMQRVAIARALAKKPALLLCDEPSGALDSKTGLHILSQLQRTAHTSNTAVVVVTHDASLASSANRLIRLADGKVVENSVNSSPEIIEERL